MLSLPRTLFAAAAMLCLTACASTYTGPVEVTRFLAENPAGLGQGDIRIVFPEEISNERARTAFAAAVGRELSAQGYRLVTGEDSATPASVSQIANVRTSRNPIEGSGRSARGPVNVGVGGRTGSYGSGVGLGIGISLGGGNSGPAIISELSVRILDASSGDTLWEGRAQLPTSVNSPYSEIDASAQTLAAALFRDFPGGNGETVQVSVRELERTP